MMHRLIPRKAFSTMRLDDITRYGLPVVPNRQGSFDAGFRPVLELQLRNLVNCRWFERELCSVR